MADQLQDFVQHMIDAGAPQETIDEGIRLYQAQHAAQPIASDEPDTYAGGFVKGAKEGMIGGAKGFVKGVAPGMVEGVKGVVTGPLALAKGAYKGVSALINDPSQAASDALDAVRSAPGRLADMASAAAQKAAVDPEGFGNDVGRLTGTAVAGIAAGRAVPLAVKPMARTAGRALQYAGEHPFATRMSGGAGVVTGVATGRPELVLGGLAAQAIPPIATKAGQALRIYGGESPAVVRLGKPAVAKLSSQFDEAMAKRGMEFYDEQKAAETNAVNLQNIENLKAHRVPSEVAIRESVSAERPNGSKSSATRTFDAPDPPKPTLTDKIDAAIAEGRLPKRREGPKPPPKGPLGQRDTSGSIRVMGKAATDLAEGKVPVASKAPMPSDVRMDELAGKLGGQPAVDAPKPTRIPTQEAIPASKSKGPMSATPGLTKSDLEAVGLNPTLNYKDLTPDLIAKIKSMRSSRHGTHYANAATDKGLRSILEDSLLMRNMERLR